MPGYILTGTPGAGKTAVLRGLEIGGHVVVEEAATAVIALDHAHGREEPWRDRAFVDRIATLQRQRERGGDLVFYDRSPICTLALARHPGHPTSPLLTREVDRAVDVYEPTVFFVRNLGFLHNTAARRIGFEDSLVFERVHEEVYRELGFTLVEVPAGPPADRVALIRRTVARLP